MKIVKIILIVLAFATISSIARCNESYILARLIYTEGRGESYGTKLKIGSVVINRVNSKIFPNSITKVINQRGQFAPLKNAPDAESKRAAKEVISKGSVLPASVMYFHASWVRSGWITSRHKYRTCGRTTFRHYYGR